ncbi:MAG TPA: hypothetical protein VKY85_19780 [Candidatus Angelobacter sp.]|nr:hypothetical protein [Candidatus Angelobacter sp.]
MAATNHRISLIRGSLLLFLVLIFLQPGRGGQVTPQITTLRIAGCEIEVTLPDEQMKVSAEELLGWVKGAAAAVSEYYGHFPVEHVTLRIRAGNGSGVRHGVTYPRFGGLILINVGQQTPAEDLKTDWTLTHEMIHLAFPNVPDDQHWVEEGISTYVEPVARAQVGNLSAKDVWKEFIRDMPKGQPESGDQGLDNTHTWGRTYWGGALFCLTADVQIRERTHNRKGLQDALRAIVDHGGRITEDWDIEKTLAIGDQGTGTKVLQELYRDMSSKPVKVDLDQLWKKLGVGLKNGEVIFDDKAVNAATRKAITTSRR